MTRNEEFEQMENDTREERKEDNRKKSSTLRKTLKRASIYGVGATAMSVRGAASLFDHTFKGLLFIADVDKTMLNFSDEFAASLGGYTKHTIGDQMFAWTVKGVSMAEKLAVKGISKGADITEKVLKDAIMRAR